MSELRAALIGGSLGLVLLAIAGLAIALLFSVVSVRPLFKWFDFWVGAFWDAKSRRLYVLPLPMLGIVIQFAPKLKLKPAPKPEPRLTCSDLDCAICRSYRPAAERKPCTVNGSHFHILSDRSYFFCEGLRTKENGRRAGSIPDGEK